MTWPQDDLSDITYSVLQWCWWLLVPECVAFILNCRCFWFVVSQYEECTFVFSPCFPDTLYELYFTRLLLIGKHGVPFYIFRLAVKLHWSKILGVSFFVLCLHWKFIACSFDIKVGAVISPTRKYSPDTTTVRKLRGCSHQ